MVKLTKLFSTDMPNHNQPIVSSDHLISESGPEQSELEYGLIIANNAFKRWIIHCVNASGATGLNLNATDVLVLHNVFHRKRAKRVADICFTLDIEDTHLVAYALRKLRKLELLDSEKHGKEVFFATTKRGQELCERYAEVRNHCLIESLNVDNKELGEVARVLRMLSGLYDQAARAATSL